MEHELVRRISKRAAVTWLVGAGVKEGSSSFASFAQRGLQCNPWKVCFVPSKVWGTFMLGLHSSDRSPDKRLMEGPRHRIVGKRAAKQTSNVFFWVTQKEIQPSMTTRKQRGRIFHIESSKWGGSWDPDGGWQELWHFCKAGVLNVWLTRKTVETEIRTQSLDSTYLLCGFSQHS